MQIANGVLEEVTARVSIIYLFIFSLSTLFNMHITYFNPVNFSISVII